MLRPFWRYYGGKWRAAPRYPGPLFDTIIEPFAGAAGYSLRYPDRNVILIDKYPVIVGIWRYLIAVQPEEVLKIPLVDAVADLPAWVPQEARWLVGFTLNSAVVSPCNTISAGGKKMREKGRVFEGWSEMMRQRVATQCPKIRHWRVIEGDYTEAPNTKAVWFVDPPYNNKAGSYYKQKFADYEALGEWCHTRLGQIIVCDNGGATLLPFRPFGVFQENLNKIGKGGSREVVWLGE